MPRLQVLYAKNGSAGLGLVGMNLGDDVKTITDYWKKEKFTFKTVMGPQEWHTKYGVSAYPTNYLVDKKGKILARYVGFDEKTLIAAIEKAGLKLKK